MTRHRRFLCGAVVCSLAVIGPRAARADFYSDAKDIITQLIQNTVAEQVIPNTAEHIPVACEFFPSTIYAIKQERYAGLQNVLRKEAADAIGFEVLQQVDPTAVVPLNHAQLAQRPKQRTLGRSAPVEVDEQAVKMIASASKLRAAANDTEQQAVRIAKSGNPGVATCTFDGNRVSVATTAMQGCAAIQTTAQRELACSAGLVASDAVEGDSTALAADARRLEAALVVVSLGETGQHTFDGVKLETLAHAAATTISDLIAGQSPEASAKDFCTGIGIVTTAASFAICSQDVQSVVGFVQSPSFTLTTIDQALAIAGQIASGCSSNACKAVVTIASGGDTVIKDVLAKDWGGAAGAVLDILQQGYCTELAKTCSNVDIAVFDFLKALAIYTVDSITSGNVGTAPDADFKAAAVKLIEEISGAGVRRKLTKDAGGLWVPELTLRDAWRPGHIGTSPGAMFEYPSVEMVRGRWRFERHPFYVAAHASLLDPIGPFVELATRDTRLAAGPNTTSAFLLGFIVPRVELELGIPDVTKNLVIGVGGALRGARAELPSATGAPVYCVIGNDCADGSWLARGSFEASIFVKYVP